MPTSEHQHQFDPRPKAIPDADPDSPEEQAAAGASIPPEPDADDPVFGPRDDSWRRHEPAKEPKGYREAQERERDEASKANREASEASQKASLAKGDHK